MNKSKIIITGEDFDYGFNELKAMEVDIFHYPMIYTLGIDINIQPNIYNYIIFTSKNGVKYFLKNDDLTTRISWYPPAKSLELGGQPASASRMRKAFQQGNWEEFKNLLSDDNFYDDDDQHMESGDISATDWHKKCIFRPVLFFDVRSFTCAFQSNLWLSLRVELCCLVLANTLQSQAITVDPTWQLLRPRRHNQ